MPISGAGDRDAASLGGEEMGAQRAKLLFNANGRRPTHCMSQKDFI
jgi:hypothetical protein